MTSSQLEASEAEELRRKLERMDARSASGPWTRETLEVISSHPRVVSTELARMLDRERFGWKADVRKLKRLGLTISHEVGYELSPRGHALLAYLRNAPK